MSDLNFVAPMMPTLVDEPPAGEEWSHEIKYDGYRTQVAVSGDRARAFTRKGHDWTAEYARLVDVIRTLGRDCHLDGEVIVQGSDGRPDFGAIRGAIARGGGDLIFYVFDLMWLDGTDLRQRSCEARREMLSGLLSGQAPNSQVQFSASFDGTGAELFNAVDDMGLEGIVSKRRSSRYRSGYKADWIKVKTFTVREFIVIGYDSNPSNPPSLLLACDAGGELFYAGRTMVSARREIKDALWERLDKIRRETPILPELKKKGTEWFEPEVRVMVKHLRGEEMLRHATLVGLL